MRLIRAKDYQDMSRKAANIISAQVILKPESVLGLATGSTPIGIYHQLIDWYKREMWISAGQFLSIWMNTVACRTAIRKAIVGS